MQTFEQAEPNWRDIVRQITCPILLIAGDPNAGSVNTPEDMKAMAAVWHRGQAVTIGSDRAWSDKDMTIKTSYLVVSIYEP